MSNNQFLKLKNSVLELEKGFKESKDKELKDRKEKIKGETEKIFHKSIVVSKYNLNMCEEQEMRKIKPVKKNWFDRLIKQNVMWKKPKIVREKLKDKTIINDIWILFETAEEKEERKKEA